LIFQRPSIKRTKGVWFLFAHATAIFILESICLGLCLKFFEVSFVTCWENARRFSLFNAIFLAPIIWLQDGLLVSKFQEIYYKCLIDVSKYRKAIQVLGFMPPTTVDPFASALTLSQFRRSVHFLIVKSD
jgi:hypothetical protein